VNHLQVYSVKLSVLIFNLCAHILGHVSQVSNHGWHLLHVLFHLLLTVIISYPKLKHNSKFQWYVALSVCHSREETPAYKDDIFCKKKGKKWNFQPKQPFCEDLLLVKYPCNAINLSPDNHMNKDWVLYLKVNDALKCET